MSDPLLPDGCKLSVLFIFHINITLIWRLGKQLLIMRSYEYNLDCPGVMSFHLVPHLPRLVAMAENFLSVKENRAI